MRRIVSKGTKERRKMGQGEGKDYRSYIRVKEFNSKGTTAIIPDWKTGRAVECFSQIEAMWYYILRWDDDNTDIREQYPLDLAATTKLAHDYGIKHPSDEDYVMTTDFCVTKTDGSRHAYAVKPDRDLDNRTIEILFLEKMYWVNQGVPFDILYGTDLNRTLASNIRLMVEFYDVDRVFDRYSLIKHLIATKQLTADLSSTILNCRALDVIASEKEGEIENG